MLSTSFNLNIYSCSRSTEPASVHASQTDLIRDLIESREKYIRKYEKLKSSITDAENSTPESCSVSEKSLALFNPPAVGTRREASPDVRGDPTRTPSIADFNQERETNVKYLDHLMSLFDRLIMEVNAPCYQVGLLSRYRIRSHVYSARSGEISQLYRLHGEAVIDQTLKIPVSNSGDQTTSADRQEGDIVERKRRRKPENFEYARKIRRDTGVRSTGSVSIRGCEEPGSNPQREALNDSFILGEGIHREVLQREICKYLGPGAYSRPSTYNV